MLSGSNVSNVVYVFTLPEMNHNFMRTVTFQKVTKWKESIIPTWTNARFKSCAVVGSAHSILYKTDGDIIDDSDAVFRVNNAPVVQSMKRHIGNKTTIIVNVFKWPWPSKKLKNEIILCLHFASCWTHAGYKNDTLDRISPELIVQTKRVVGLRKHTHPSCGLIALFLARHMCDNVKAFGFSMIESHCARYYGKCISPNIYYSTGFDGAWSLSHEKRRKFRSPHEWEKEKKWMRSQREIVFYS